MTGLMAIDESGDLGSSGSRFFVIASVISPSSRELLSASRLLPKASKEKKFYNSSESEIGSILASVAGTAAKISYVVTEKNNPLDNNFVYGVDLYRRSLRDLVDVSLDQIVGKDINIMVDGSRYIQQSELRRMCEELCMEHGKNLKKCFKGISQNEPCLRLADYVVGSIRYSYEESDDTYKRIIDRRISFARRY